MDNAYFKLGLDYESIYAYLKTESRYKKKPTTESCFHLHKILDSVKCKLKHSSINVV